MKSSRADSLSESGTTIPPNRTILKTTRKFDISTQRSMKKRAKAIIPLLCIFCLPDLPPDDWSSEGSQAVDDELSVKQQLATHYAMDLMHSSKPGDTIFVRTAYLAGFEKAREMIVDEMLRSKSRGKYQLIREIDLIGEESAE